MGDVRNFIKERKIMNRPHTWSFAGLLYSIPPGESIFIEDEESTRVYSTITSSPHLRHEDFEVRKFVAFPKVTKDIKGNIHEILQITNIREIE